PLRIVIAPRGFNGAIGPGARWLRGGCRGRDKPSWGLERRMADLANILVVGDLHFGEERSAGAPSERRHAVGRGARAFRALRAEHTSRRLDGRPWRLVIAGDLFDFMSVVVPSTPALPARTPDERQFGLGRSAAAGIVRMRRICENHQGLLA